MCNCHVFHITVTKGTNLFDVFDGKIPVKHKPFQMLLVGKVNEVWNVMHFLPGRRRFLFPIFGEFLNTRFVSRNNFMASHTFAGRRNAGYFTAARVSVAVHTIDAVVFYVDVMWKLNGLFHIFAVVAPTGGYDFS